MNLFNGCSDQKLANDLQWMNPPRTWSFEHDGLRIVPEKGTDFFRPFDGESRDSAGLLYKKVRGDFTIISNVSANLKGFGDAACVTIRSRDNLWAKLCLEKSPTGELNAVSVITDPWSDDCNGELIQEPECWLRITRKGNLFGMHYSLNGSQWRYVRSAPIKMPEEILVGVHAQAPFQSGCEVLICSFNLSNRTVEDFRSGE